MSLTLAACSSPEIVFGLEVAERATQLIAIVKDVREFLVDLPFAPPPGRLERRSRNKTPATSPRPAHNRGAAHPAALIPCFIDMVESSWRCGASDTCSITQRDFFLKRLDSEISVANETGADGLARRPLRLPYPTR